MFFVNTHVYCQAYFYLDHFRHFVVLFITVIPYTSKGFKRFKYSCILMGKHIFDYSLGCKNTFLFFNIIVLTDVSEQT